MSADQGLFLDSDVEDQEIPQQIVELLETYADAGKLEQFLQDALITYRQAWGEEVSAKNQLETASYMVDTTLNAFRSGQGHLLNSGQIKALTDLITTAQYGKRIRATNDQIKTALNVASSLLPKSVQVAGKILPKIVNRDNMRLIEQRGGHVGNMAGRYIRSADYLERRWNDLRPLQKWSTVIGLTVPTMAATLNYVYGLSTNPTELFSSFYSVGEGDEQKDKDMGNPTARTAVENEYEKNSHKQLARVLKPVYDKMMATKYNPNRNYGSELDQLINMNTNISDDTKDSYVVRELRRVYEQIKARNPARPEDYSVYVDLPASRLNRYNSIVY